MNPNWTPIAQPYLLGRADGNRDHSLFISKAKKEKKIGNNHILILDCTLVNVIAALRVEHFCGSKSTTREVKETNLQLLVQPSLDFHLSAQSFRDLVTPGLASK